MTTGLRHRTCKICKKKFMPNRMAQIVCCEECLCMYFQKLKKKSRSIARRCALSLGYKSMSEVKFAQFLLSEGIKFKYEPDIFKYQMPEQKYTPDYRIQIGSKITYIEYKGKLDSKTRRMLIVVKDQHPHIDLRLVFEKPNNRIYKGSKMRYCDWANKYEFKWYSVKQLAPLIKDLKPKRIKNDNNV